MIYIKLNFPREKYETTFLTLWEWMFYKGIDISKPEELAEVLRSNGYSDSEVGEILASASKPEFKEALTANTQTALDKGAYGAPWFWVRNSEGKEEPFFGSDRYVFVYFFFLGDDGLEADCGLG
jgi:2-hydroxychromene-2-carboxylate isomerase